MRKFITTTGAVALVGFAALGFAAPASATGGHHGEHPPAASPQVQDYVTCDGAAFVLDNTSSSVPVHFTVAGKPFDVAAGAAVHTDADGYRFPADIGPYTVTAYPGDRAWTFAPPSGCAPSTPPAVEVAGAPAFTVTPATCEAPTNSVAYTLPEGLTIEGATGQSGTIDAELLALYYADDDPYNGITVGIIVRDGYTYSGPDFVRVTGLVNPATLDCCPPTTTPTPTPTPEPTPGGTPSPTPADEPTTPVTPPTGEPTTPAPSDEPTTPAPASPTPTAGTTPPAVVPDEPVAPAATSPGAPSTQPSTASAVPVADVTSPGTVRELAYTGVDRTGTIVGLTAAVLAIAAGVSLILWRRARRHV